MSNDKSAHIYACLPFPQQYNRPSKVLNPGRCPVWVQGWLQQLLQQIQVSKAFSGNSTLINSPILCVCLFYMRGWTGLRRKCSLDQRAAGSLVHRSHKALTLLSSRRQQELVWLWRQLQSVQTYVELYNSSQFIDYVTDNNWQQDFITKVKH